jgi:hypothetical protein
MKNVEQMEYKENGRRKGRREVKDSGGCWKKNE